MLRNSHVQVGTASRILGTFSFCLAFFWPEVSCFFLGACPKGGSMPGERLGRRADFRPAPSEKRIRTLIQELDAENLDQVIGGWLRALADAGRLEPLLTAIAIDGKWPRGVGDGQVKLFAAMLHEQKMIIAVIKYRFGVPARGPQFSRKNPRRPGRSPRRRTAWPRSCPAG
jgi:hypothetical protein